MVKSSPPEWARRLGAYKWSLVALLGLCVGMLLSRGGLRVLMPLGRLLAPAVVVVLIYRGVKRKLTGAAQSYLKRQMEQQGWGGRPQRPGPQSDGRVIDLCPRCGSYLAPGHRCQT